MSTKPFSESFYDIHEGNGDEFIRIGPDKDSPDLICIQLRSPDGKEQLARITCSVESVPLLVKALQRAAQGIEGMAPVHVGITPLGTR